MQCQLNKYRKSHIPVCVWILVVLKTPYVSTLNFLCGSYYRPIHVAFSLCLCSFLVLIETTTACLNNFWSFFIRPFRCFWLPVPCIRECDQKDFFINLYTSLQPHTHTCFCNARLLRCSLMIFSQLVFPDGSTLH